MTSTVTLVITGVGNTNILCLFCVFEARRCRNSESEDEEFGPFSRFSKASERIADKGVSKYDALSIEHVFCFRGSSSVASGI